MKHLSTCVEESNESSCVVANDSEWMARDIGDPDERGDWVHRQWVVRVRKREDGSVYERVGRCTSGDV